jgi:putative transposase
MNFVGGELYHVYNQGNNQELIFFENKNYLFFLGKMRKHLLRHCDFLAWCLMPNHFHWLIRMHDDYDSIRPQNLESLAAPVVLPMNRSISTLLSSYTKAMNRMYDRSGKLIRSNTKAKPLNKCSVTDDFYPLICFNYIHQNPLKSGLVKTLEGWKFSSFRDYAGIRNGTLCDIELTKQLLELPVDNNKFIKQAYHTIPSELQERLFN